MSKNIVFNTPIKAVEQKEEQASAANPTLTWMDFIFTDDQPNDNGVGVRADQFTGLIHTGIYMPLKVASGQIAPGHEHALPLGVISNLELKYEETSKVNSIIGKAALWAEERPEDVASLKSAFAAGEPLHISWELLYNEEEIDDAGIRWLVDPIVRAATIVGVAAYGGRTPVLAVAALEGEREPTSEHLSEAAVWTTAYINDLPDSAFLYVEKGGTKDKDGKTTPRSLRHFPYKNADGQIDLPHLRNALARIPQASIPDDVKKRLITKAQRILAGQKSEGQSSVEEETVELEELQTKLAEATTEIETLKAQVTAANDELKTLREYKAAVELKEAQAALLQSRLAAFAEAGITVTPEDIQSKQAHWLKLDDEAFAFLVNEMKGMKTVTASLGGGNPPAVPEPVGTGGATTLTAENLKKALEKKSK